jgi:hypothetical protein
VRSSDALRSNSMLELKCEFCLSGNSISRIPTSYSALINRVPREWHIVSIRSLIVQQYLSTVQVTRIFRDGQTIHRMRVDFRTDEDCRRFSNDRTFLSTAYDIQPWLTSHLLESIDAFAVKSSDTKQSTALTNRNATNAERTMNTIEIVRMLSNASIPMPSTRLVHRTIQ